MTIQAKQTLQQRLLLAPNIALALEVLRMPAMELQIYLRQQLEENPLLEIDDAMEEADPRVQSELQPDPQDASQNGDTPQAHLDEDWMVHWHGDDEREEPEDGPSRRDQRATTASSLYESLQLQLGYQTFSPEEHRLALAIIDHLDEYGYLDAALEGLAAEFGANADQMGAALRIIQQMEPAGVGARDLRECLMLQLEHQDARESLAYRILQDAFHHFSKNRPEAIVRALAAPMEAVAAACEQLRQLNPKPGGAFSGDLPPSVVPDLVIHRRERHFDVELNDQELPQIKVNRSYYRMLKDPKTPEEAKGFLTEKFRRAAWLIKAIDERNATLLAIARCLISLQNGFLEHGPRALKPLTQSQVAALIGRHSSTVSRAITGKSIDTPYGIFRLEQLFASGVPQAARAGEVSDEMVKFEIQRLIAHEDPQRPLSDAAMVHRLAQRSLSVARRTIAKYRAELKILPAHLRRRTV